MIDIYITNGGIMIYKEDKKTKRWYMENKHDFLWLSFMLTLRFYTIPLDMYWLTLALTYIYNL